MKKSELRDDWTAHAWVELDEDLAEDGEADDEHLEDVLHCSDQQSWFQYKCSNETTGSFLSWFKVGKQGVTV